MHLSMDDYTQMSAGAWRGLMIPGAGAINDHESSDVGSGIETQVLQESRTRPKLLNHVFNPSLLFLEITIIFRASWHPFGLIFISLMIMIFLWELTSTWPVFLEDFEALVCSGQYYLQGVWLAPHPKPFFLFGFSWYLLGFFFILCNIFKSS